MTQRQAILGSFAALGLMLAVAGCGSSPPAKRLSCHLPSPEALKTLDRVVMVELDYQGDIVYPQLQQEMTEALFQAVQKQGLFHLEMLPADSPVLAELPWRTEQRKTLKDLAVLRKALGCDTVLVGTIHHFQSYPRMQMRMYLQLLDLKGGKLLWGLEHSWDTSDQQTEERIRNYFEDNVAEEYAPLDWRLATMSPQVFERFVAWESAQTMKLPVPGESSESRAKRQAKRVAKKMFN